MKEFPLTMVKIKTDKKVVESGTELRGFIAAGREENPLIHQHVGEFLVYSYPLIQYKVIEGQPIIWGIAEASSIIDQIATDLNEMKLGRHKYKVKWVEVSSGQVKIGVSNHFIKYDFVTPWIALNQYNYQRFVLANDWKERKEILRSVLIGNLLSLSKGLRIVVTKKIWARTKLDMVKVRYKGVPHIGFTGSFQVNFYLPYLIGIGKGASRGHGSVILSIPDDQ